MTKRKLHHLHKIKVHHNRWLIWAIAYALFVAVAIIGYLKVSDLNLDVESQNTYQPTHSYNDKRLGFSLRYPATWSIESSSDTSTTFLPNDSSDEGVVVSVLIPTAETAIRKSLNKIDEDQITVSGISGSKVINDLTNGHKESVVLVQYNGRLYIIRGSQNYVDKLLLNFYFN
jgi:hypothetical protein